MELYDELRIAVVDEREYLFTSPIIGDALEGKICLTQYVAFLREAYFHVSQTVPLLMACGSRLRSNQEWLRGAVAHYIDDEYGHEQWILDDIAACGADADSVRDGEPSRATELMVSYAWDVVSRRNPIGFFGMVYVLEGTSVVLATRAASTIQRALDLPDQAFRYLVSHGNVDQDHIKFLETVLNRIDNPRDRAAVTHCARRFFYLYAEIFRSLPSLESPESDANLRDVA